MLQDVVDVGAGRRQDVDARQVASGAAETVVHRVTVDHQHLAVETGLREGALQRLGLRVAQLEAVDHHQAVAGLGGERHLEPERTDLLVERLLELAQTGTVGLAAADEDRRPAIAVTSGTAALLATELLAGASDIGPLASRAGSAAPVL